MRRVLLALLIVSAGVVAQPAAARLNPVRSEVRFTITKLGYSDVTGRFRKFSGQLRYDPAHPENSSVQWRVGVAPVETGGTVMGRLIGRTVRVHLTAVEGDAQ